MKYTQVCARVTKGYRPVRLNSEAANGPAAPAPRQLAPFRRTQIRSQFDEKVTQRLHPFSRLLPSAQPITRSRRTVVHT